MAELTDSTNIAQEQTSEGIPVSSTLRNPSGLLGTRMGHLNSVPKGHTQVTSLYSFSVRV
ncbi:hypothetical protein C0992_011515 [Termitomyces sp. T32_za158]|nr:hypothetical protein C0992_011515 [Termitomyces sp. T32_za158]